MSDQLPTTITALTERIRHITQSVADMRRMATDFINSIQGPELATPALDPREPSTLGAIKPSASTLSDAVEELSIELNRLHDQFRRVNIGDVGQTATQARALR